MTPEFNATEAALLQKHRLAVFRGCLIYDAQPPITPAQAAQVEAQIGTAIPAGLRSLWNTAFGGSLGYDLIITEDGTWDRLSLVQLFHPTSQDYHTLDGWIDYEKELAEEARGDDFDGILDYLPFGGFEYLERAYVVSRDTAKDPAGTILYYTSYVPEWARITEKEVVVLAPSIDALFDSFAFKANPFEQDVDELSRDTAMLEALDALHADGEAGAALCGRLSGLIRNRCPNPDVDYTPHPDQIIFTPEKDPWWKRMFKRS